MSVQYYIVFCLLLLLLFFFRCFLFICLFVFFEEGITLLYQSVLQLERMSVSPTDICVDWYLSALKANFGYIS